MPIGIILTFVSAPEGASKGSVFMAPAASLGSAQGRL